MTATRTLALALVGATLACMPIHYHLPGRHFLPARGVLVNGRFDCGRGCALSDTAIQAIDGVEVHDATSVYRALSDGRVHQLAVESRTGNATIAARIRPSELHEFHFVAVEALDETEPFGRHARWSYAMASTVFYARDRAWRLPDDLLGQPYLIVDVPGAPHELADLLIAELREGVDGSFEIFALRPGGVDEFADAVWRDAEEDALADLPRVHVVTTPWNTIEARSVYASGLYFGLHFGPPNTFVIDCHGVVRWHAGVDPFASELPRTFAPWLDGALRMATKLVEDVEAGRCWTQW